MKAEERRKHNAAMAERNAAGASYSELAREFNVARSTAQKTAARSGGPVKASHAAKRRARARARTATKTEATLDRLTEDL